MTGCRPVTDELRSRTLAGSLVITWSMWWSKSETLPPSDSPSRLELMQQLIGASVLRSTKPATFSMSKARVSAPVTVLSSELRSPTRMTGSEPVAGPGRFDQFCRLRGAVVGLERLEVGVDEPERPAPAHAGVGGRPAAFDRQRMAEDRDRERSFEIGPFGIPRFDARVAPLEDHVAHRQAAVDVGGRAPTRVGGNLEVELGLDDDDFVLRAARVELTQQFLQVVVFDRGRARACRRGLRDWAEPCARGRPPAGRPGRVSVRGSPGQALRPGREVVVFDFFEDLPGGIEQRFRGRGGDRRVRSAPR